VLNMSIEVLKMKAYIRLHAIKAIVEHNATEPQTREDHDQRLGDQKDKAIVVKAYQHNYSMVVVDCHSIPHF